MSLAEIKQNATHSCNMIDYPLICFHSLCFLDTILLLTVVKGDFMDTREMLASRMKKLRRENQMTQQEVADKINTSRSSYSQYELGTKQPSIETLTKLAELYQTSIDYLVGRY